MRTRREFVKKVAQAAVGFASAPLWSPASGVQASPAVAREGRKVKYVGWEEGITYQTPARGGLDRDYLMRLLDEMAENKMNLLSLMMNSSVEYDPIHDGYCWPVRNPKLKNYWDATSINGQPSTEFVREVITAAADRRIQIHFFMNGWWWTPEKISKGYPTAERQATRAGKLHPKPHYCPDSPGAWQAGLDEVSDLLTYYSHPNVRGYGFEMLLDNGCFCQWTQEKYRRETGASIFDAKGPQLHDWRAERIRGYLKAYADHIRRLVPSARVFLSTYGRACAAGHEPAMLKANGIDYVTPQVFHFPTTKAQLHARLKKHVPMPCLLHFCTRDRRPENYNLWIKTPEIIRQAIDWVLEYPGDNVAGFIFFNENATSPQNKKAVYEQIKRFSW